MELTWGSNPLRPALQADASTAFSLSREPFVLSPLCPHSVSETVFLCPIWPYSAYLPRCILLIPNEAHMGRCIMSPLL